MNLESAGLGLSYCSGLVVTVTCLLDSGQNQRRAQTLVEKALQHGLRSSPHAGRLSLVVRATGPWLEMSVSDDGQGVPSTEVEQLFFAERQSVHALTLLRRRLQTLFGRSFQLEVRSEIGEGTTVTMHISLQTRFKVRRRSLETVGADTGQVAPNQNPS